MKPLLFSIGPVKVYGYGLMIALACILAIWVGEYRGKKKYGIDKDMVFNCFVLSALAGLVGAKLFFFLTEMPSLLADPIGFLKENLTSGFVVYGGIICGALFGIVYCSKKKVCVRDMLDLAAPSIALGQGIGRFGCFLAGCCYGKESHSDWFYVIFPENSSAPAGVKLIPTQLISCGLDLIFFLLLCLYAKKCRKKGRVMSLYLIGYAIGRSIVEIFRNDFRGNVGILSTSQFISVFILLAGVVLFLLFGRASQTPKKQASAITHVFFDLDGTLTDPKEGITKSVQYALRHFGIEEEELTKLEVFIGPPLKDSFRELYGFDEAQCEEAIPVFRNYFEKAGIFENKVVEGVPEMLKALTDAGIKCVITSSKPEIYARKIMEHFELSGYMSEIVGIDLDEKFGFTKPEVVAEAIRRLNISEEERTSVVVVGDRRFDILAAKEAGLQSIGVTYGYAPEGELEEAGADQLVASVAELSAALLK